MSTRPARIYFSLLAAAGLTLGLAACEAPVEEAEPPTASTDLPAGFFSQDQHSFARPGEARVTHMTIDLTVDFDDQVLDGSVELDLQRMQARPAYRPGEGARRRGLARDLLEVRPRG